MADLGGINTTHAIAGVGGALASLPFLKPSGKLLVLGSVTAGLVTAAFLTPIAAEILASPTLFGVPLTVRAENGLAFLLGLTAMILIPAILGVVTWMRDNVTRLMERVTGVSPKSGGDNGCP